MSKPQKRKKTPTDPLEVIDKRLEQYRFRSSIISLTVKIVAVILVVVFVFTVFFGVSVQGGEGMYPRIRDGDIMIWFRNPTQLVTGEIITLKKDGVQYTGRIVAIAGDIVNISEDGKLIVNGAIQYEEIYYETYTQESTLAFPYTVPENSYFILGDMRTGAKDSRDIGAINRDDIDGKVITIIRRRGL